MATSEWNPDPLNVGLAGLSVSMRLLDKLIDKRLLTPEEVVSLIQDALDRFKKKADRDEAYQAVKAAMPNLPF